MTLEEYRIKNDLDYGEIAELAGIANNKSGEVAARRWCAGVFPRKYINNITKNTKGKVTANSFFH